MSKVRRKKKLVSLAHIATGASALKIEMVEVQNPLALNPKDKIIVARNLTPLADLFNKGKIDATQHYAGEKFAEKYRKAEFGGAKAIDYTREHVDGGPTPEPLSVEQQEALDWLRRVSRYPGIGKHGYSVLRAVCGDEKTIVAYAKETGIGAGSAYGINHCLRARQDYLSIRLIEAIDSLVDFLDALGRGRDKGKVRAEYGANLAGGGGEYELDKFGDLVLLRRA